MARYEHLWVYRSAFKFCVQLELSVKLFSRYYKYSIWQKMREIWYKILINIVDVNSSYDKKEKLYKLKLLIEKELILLRLWFEIKCFESIWNYEHIVSIIVDLSKQIEWRYKSLNQKN